MIKKNKGVWRNRSVLVTGGAGFIGSWLSHDLLQQGAKVTIVDLKKALPYLGKRENAILTQSTFIRGDVRDGTLLTSLYKKYKIQTVFHLAAEAIVRKAFQNPIQTLDTNVRGTWEVLETFRKVYGGKGQVVVASSDKAYGSHKSLPYKENFALLGENPYDCSKACADRIAQMYAKVYGVPVCITRCGNVFGGGDMNFSRLIPGSIRSFFFEKSFKIRSDGLFKRDYIYIKDIVSAYMYTAEAMIDGDVLSEVFNFGNNSPIEVADVVKFIAQEMRSEHTKLIILSAARYEIKDQYLDSTKAMNMLGWNPQYSFAEGIKKTVRWYRDFFQNRYPL